MPFTIVKSQEHSNLWLVKDSNNMIRKYAYSEEEAKQWVKDKS